jgi:membrane protease YdiL (CAAX protease family)
MEGGAPAPVRGIRARLSQSRILILVELAVIAAIFIADDVYHRIWFSKTIYLFAIGVVSLLILGRGWSQIGFRFGPKWVLFALVGLIGGGLIEAQELYLTQPFLIRLTGQAPDLHEFRALYGNATLLLIGLALVWVLAAFGEEWVWRGFVTNRLADLFGRKGLGVFAAVILANVAFGLAHLYQGLTGVLEAGEDGLLFAVLYFATGRNLIAPMVAHGVQDTVDLLLVFTGTYPIAV